MTQVSFFDQLMTHTPSINQTPLLSKQEVIQCILKSISLNVEALLSTKCFFQTIPSSFTELNVSVLKYGTEDFSSLSIFSELNMNKTCLSLEKALSLYEPRLSNITVTRCTKNPILFSVKATLYTNDIVQDALFELAFTSSYVHSIVQNIRLVEESY